jgi:hypothetical protein
MVYRPRLTKPLQKFIMTIIRVGRTMTWTTVPQERLGVATAVIPCQRQIALETTCTTQEKAMIASRVILMTNMPVLILLHLPPKASYASHLLLLRLVLVVAGRR